MRSKKPAPYSLRDVISPEIASEFSTRAENKISYLTVPASSKGFQDYASLTVNFLGITVLMTSGGIIEFNRFFPDCMLW